MLQGMKPCYVPIDLPFCETESVVHTAAGIDIPFGEDEDTEVLRDRLAGFYAQRTLTKTPVTPADQAEVAYLLTSSKLSKTVGQIISVDGGLQDAFLR